MVVSFDTVGHEHSTWNICLAVLHSGRLVPQSGVVLICCGTPCCAIAASLLLSVQLIVNGIVSLILLTDTLLLGITHLRVLILAAPSVFAPFLNLE